MLFLKNPYNIYYDSIQLQSKWWFTVKMTMSNGNKQTLTNITEILYNYKSFRPNNIAFESDIDQIGYTYGIEMIKEFEVKIN